MFQYRARLPSGLPPTTPPALRSLPLRRLVREPVPNRTERDRILAGLTTKSSGPAKLDHVTVTQIVDPRQAYWEIAAPGVVVPLDRIEKMEAGSVFHDRFSHVVSAEAFREQMVFRERIRGKIDIYENHPVEVKTTGPMPEDIARDRPSYLAQLLFYCALVEKESGHIVVISRSGPEVRGFDLLRAFRVEVTDVDRVWEEAKRRRDLLLDAWGRRDPSRLPGCGWFSAGCKFEGRCDCTSGASDDDRAMLSVAKVTHDPEEELRLKRLLLDNGEAAWKHEDSFAADTVPPLKLRDFVFLRKNLIDRLDDLERGPDGKTPGEEEEATPAVTTGGAEKLQEISGSATFSGIRKRVLREAGASYVHLRRGVIDDPWVSVSGGTPLLFKMTKLRRPVDRDELVKMFPDEIAQLGVSASLLGARRGRLVLYYERVEDEKQKLLVYDVDFRDTKPFEDGAVGIAEAWAAAWKARDPSLLPACPSWSVERCRLGERCACRTAERLDPAP